MGMPGGWELFAIILVIVLLFGGKKIPELAKGLGKGIKDFKKAVNEDETESTKTVNAKELEAKKEETTAVETKDTKQA